MGCHKTKSGCDAKQRINTTLVESYEQCIKGSEKPIRRGFRWPQTDWSGAAITISGDFGSWLAVVRGPE